MGGTIRDVIVLLRPKQWIKNLFVFAAGLFSQRLFEASAWPQTLIAFAAFCLLSSGVYAINDVADRQKDQNHPRKKNRPVASGRIAPGAAIAIGIVLSLGGLFCGALIGRAFLLVMALYLLNSTLYTLVLKKVVILDVFSIAANFILRMVAGAVAVGVEASVWLLLCTLQLALLLALSKRRAELLLLSDDAAEHRKSLGSYSPAFIDQMLTVTMTSTVVFYSLYTFFERPPITMLTLVFVLYGLFRYQYLIMVQKRTESIEEILLSDWPMLIDIFLWVVTWLILMWLT